VFGVERLNSPQTPTTMATRRLVEWAPADAVLVFEDLQIDQPYCELTRGVALRRRLSQWQHGAIRTAAANKARLAGLAIASVNPAYTSRNCSRCGLRGKRHRHKFTCPSCGHTQHADVNAATNIRNRYVQFRLDGELSTSPEALPHGEGKRPPSGGSR
jgi:putative transposase